MKLFCVFAILFAAGNAKAEEFPDRIATWLRNHNFDQVISSGKMSAGRLGDVYVIASDDFVIVREATSGRTPTWTAKMIDALHFAFTGNQGLLMRTNRSGERHVATIWPADRDDQVREFAKLQEAGKGKDDEQYKLAVIAIQGQLERQK